ncbi:MAG: ABC-2 family transporter protein [Peptoniphilaceae bacterium]|nr:ABC-2 family transporter protein [Peptoniphilaceae bacterium]MDD7383669.1 ABC-2 family transporter protein [Peptoniphilaceae bacterium]MDY3737840.1 ABC-2 family transporter protein [Peptoniphilaceae bacterium]
MKLKKYWDIYLKTFKLNLKSLMIYDVDFIIGIFAMLIKTLINFSVILIIFNVVSNINGWTFEQMLFLYGFSTTSFAIWHCFFINTITIPYYIKTGEFDRFLTKPFNPLFLILIEGFDEDGRSELLFGLIISIISILNLHLYSPLILILPPLWLVCSLIYAAISIILSTVSFFTIDNVDITDLTLQLNEFSKYPINIFGKFLMALFTIVFPIGFASYYPSLIFIEKFTSTNIFFVFITFFYSIIFFIVSIFIWMKCLKKYTSSGF